MKKVISFSFIVFYSFSLLAQANSKSGIQFYKGSWKEVLDAAGKVDKMIFIDVSTDWCAPCKYMEKFIFTKQDIGKKYNAAFLNYQINAEKGEGVEIARKYEVSAYPTFLFVNSKGYLIYKVTGERDATDFSRLVQEAKQQITNPNNLGVMKQAFDDGNRDPSFLHNYLNHLADMEINNGDVLDAYFNTLTDEQLQQDTMLLYMAKYIPREQTAFSAYLINHYDQLADTSKVKLSEFLFDRVIRLWGGTALTEKRFPEYVALRKFGDKLDRLSNREKQFLQALDLKYGVMVRDYELIKGTGYLHTAGLLLIPLDSIRREDKRRFEESQQYIIGETDSAKIAAFEEEKIYRINMYSREISVPLFQAAEAFSHLPSTEKVALRDALAWAMRCKELMSDPDRFNDLINKLELKINQ